MRTKENKIEKRIYIHPEVICIELDNEISLALESSPPIFPGEDIGQSMQNIENNPFKDNGCLV